MAGREGPELRRVRDKQKQNGVRELYTRAQFQAVLEYQQVTPWNHQSRGRKNLCSVVHPGLGRDCQQCATCHFCRQKTDDPKTSCGGCGRGQWCGNCLELRVGQNLDEVLADPDWRCPVCLDICNCSAPPCVRGRQGWEPTQQLSSEATHLRYASVAHYLIATALAENAGVTQKELEQMESDAQRVRASRQQVCRGAAGFLRPGAPRKKSAYARIMERVRANLGSPAPQADSDEDDDFAPPARTARAPAPSAPAAARQPAARRPAADVRGAAAALAPVLPSDEEEEEEEEEEEAEAVVVPDSEVLHERQDDRAQKATAGPKSSLVLDQQGGSRQRKRASEQPDKQLLFQQIRARAAAEAGGDGAAARHGAGAGVAAHDEDVRSDESDPGDVDPSPPPSPLPMPLSAPRAQPQPPPRAAVATPIPRARPVPADGGTGAPSLGHGVPRLPSTGLVRRLAPQQGAHPRAVATGGVAPEERPEATPRGGVNNFLMGDGGHVERAALPPQQPRQLQPPLRRSAGHPGALRAAPATGAAKRARSSEPPRRSHAAGAARAAPQAKRHRTHPRASGVETDADVDSGGEEQEPDAAAMSEDEPERSPPPADAPPEPPRHVARLPGAEATAAVNANEESGEEEEESPLGALLASARAQAWGELPPGGALRKAAPMLSQLPKGAVLAEEGDESERQGVVEALAPGAKLAISRLSDLEHAADLLLLLALPGYLPDAQVRSEVVQRLTAGPKALALFQACAPAPRLVLLEKLFMLARLLLERRCGAAEALAGLLAHLEVLASEHAQLHRELSNLGAATAAKTIGSLHLPAVQSKLDGFQRKTRLEERLFMDREMLEAALNMAAAVARSVRDGVGGPAAPADMLQLLHGSCLTGLMVHGDSAIRRAALRVLTALAELAGSPAPAAAEGGEAQSELRVKGQHDTAANLVTHAWPALIQMVDSEYPLRVPGTASSKSIGDLRDVRDAMGAVAAAALRHKLLPWSRVEAELLKPHGAATFWRCANSGCRTLSARLLADVVRRAPSCVSAAPADPAALLRAWMVMLVDAVTTPATSDFLVALRKLTQALRCCPLVQPLFQGVTVQRLDSCPQALRALAGNAAGLADADAQLRAATPRWAPALVDALQTRNVAEQSDAVDELVGSLVSLLAPELHTPPSAGSALRRMLAHLLSSAARRPAAPVGGWARLYVAPPAVALGRVKLDAPLAEAALELFQLVLEAVRLDGGRLAGVVGALGGPAAAEARRLLLRCVVPKHLAAAHYSPQHGALAAAAARCAAQLLVVDAEGLAGHLPHLLQPLLGALQPPAEHGGAAPPAQDSTRCAVHELLTALCALPALMGDGEGQAHAAGRASADLPTAPLSSGPLRSDATMGAPALGAALNPLLLAALQDGVGAAQRLTGVGARAAAGALDGPSADVHCAELRRVLGFPLQHPLLDGKFADVQRRRVASAGGGAAAHAGAAAGAASAGDAARAALVFARSLAASGPAGRAMALHALPALHAAMRHQGVVPSRVREEYAALASACDAVGQHASLPCVTLAAILASSDGPEATFSVHACLEGSPKMVEGASERQRLPNQKKRALKLLVTDHSQPTSAEVFIWGAAGERAKKLLDGLPQGGRNCLLLLRSLKLKARKDTLSYDGDGDDGANVVQTVSGSDTLSPELTQWALAKSAPAVG